MLPPPDVIGTFLDGCRTVATALADPSVAAAWDRPSVLEDQLVSSLAGHLARGGVWVVADYLGTGEPAGPPDFHSAGDYFTVLMGGSTPDDHRAIRDRGAAVASVGRDELLVDLGRRLRGLESQLQGAPADRLVAAASGRSIRLGDYLCTRIVEQVVHLDDLARSVGHEPWALPPRAQEITIAVGVDVARRRRGPDAVIRALYRRGFAEEALPVL